VLSSRGQAPRPGFSWVRNRDVTGAEKVGADSGNCEKPTPLSSTSLGNDRRVLHDTFSARSRTSLTLLIQQLARGNVEEKQGGRKRKTPKAQRVSLVESPEARPEGSVIEKDIEMKMHRSRQRRIRSLRGVVRYLSRALEWTGLGGDLQRRSIKYGVHVLLGRDLPQRFYYVTSPAGGRWPGTGSFDRSRKRWMERKSHVKDQSSGSAKSGQVIREGDNEQVPKTITGLSKKTSLQGKTPGAVRTTG